MTAKESIRRLALEIGFDDCRFSTAEPPDHGAAYQHWIENGRHGELGWMERNVHKRLDPTEIVPGAKSIVCLTTSYSSDRESRPTAIARYARYRDYHDVIAKPLKQLTAHINALLGEEAKSKASL